MKSYRVTYRVLGDPAETAIVFPLSALDIIPQLADLHRVNTVEVHVVSMHEIRLPGVFKVAA
jgi:hypothetical protein